MKKILIVLLFALSLISVPVFAKMVKVDKEVKKFDSISLRYPGIVHLKQGDTESLTIEADDAVIEEINTRISGNTLIIKGNENWWEKVFGFNSYFEDEASFYITMKDMKKISVNGSNTINIETSVKTDNLEINIRGKGALKSTEDIIVRNDLSVDCSGKAELELKKLTASSLNINISGSGDIKILAGSVNKQKIDVSGAGVYIASEVISKEADINCSGSGKLEVNVTDTLKADISGSGNIIYCGEPKKLEQRVSGSGIIQKSLK